MKKLFSIFGLLFIAAIFMQLSSQAQVFVKVKPRETVVVTNRPSAPSPRHIWVEGDWVWRGNTYVRE